MELVGSSSFPALNRPMLQAATLLALNCCSHFDRRVLLGALALLVGCSSQTPSDSLGPAREAMKQGDTRQAETLAKAISPDDPAWANAQMLLGELAAMAGDSNASLAYLESIPRNGTADSLRAAQAIMDIQSRHGSLQSAAETMEYLLQHQAQDFRLQMRLARLLSRCGLRSHADVYLMHIIKSGRIEVEDIVLLSEPDRRSDEAQTLRQRADAHPEDLFSNFGLALEDYSDHKLAEAQARVTRVVQSRPDFAEAQALLGELSLDGELSELEAWHARLPELVQNDAGVWFVRGQWARRINQDQVAARCYWETIRQAPLHRRAMYQLGQVLQPFDPAAAAAFSHRAAQLYEYSVLMEKVLISQGQDRDGFQRMVGLLDDMGRPWEAWAWMALARGMRGPEAGSAHGSPTSFQQPDAGSPRFLASKDVALQHDLSHYPDFNSLRSQIDAGVAPKSPPARIRFDDHATELGIDFTFFQSRDPDPHVVRIFESTGGGAGVLDFDLDGWPDLFLTQGQEWPRGQDHPTPSGAYRDRLYRNIATEFRDVTDVAGLILDEGYGQGCSCGDFNNDGFADLYVANIGGNRLLLNHGDGTFADVTADAGLSGSAWTTSCLILDLNADGNPDLYDVNYLQGDDVFRVECAANRCSVRGFQGAPDEVRLSQGDGTFATVPDATPLENGKGLGIVALFVNGEPRPSLFVGNDQVPNFFLRPTNTEGRYSDEALPHGLALNRDGNSTASMGVAAGDINHDWRTDLLVTNFEGEANTLFLQREQGLFEDAVVGSGLMSPGIPYVGWGAQFFDADNDGELDLVVANGHVAEFGEPGVEYRMPTQFFRNAGRGTFLQAQPGDVGEFFARRLLGRSVATLDWNRDGLQDFVLSSIESPAAVLTNRTERAGHWLDVYVRARHSARDGIGTMVEVHQGSAVHSQQLIAGDGYQATNERKLHFGLPTTDTIERLIVHWPSGETATFADVPVDSAIVLVEGRPAFVLSRVVRE